MLVVYVFILMQIRASLKRVIKTILEQVSDFYVDSYASNLNRHISGTLTII